MKNISLLLILIAVCTTAIAQDIGSEEKIYKNEFGIDATGFIKNFLNFGYSEYGNYYYPDVYTITYHRVCKNGAVRIALGTLISTDKDTGGYNSNTNFKNIDNGIYTKAGYELRSKFGKRWQAYYGVDLIFNYRHQIGHNMGTSYGRPDVITNTREFGGGPCIGIEFLLNERLSLSTEGYLYNTFRRSETEYNYDDNPEYNVYALYENNRMTIVSPLRVFVKFRF